MTGTKYLAIATALAAPILFVSPGAPVLAVIDAETSECVDVPDSAEGDVAIVNITPSRAADTGYGALRAFGDDPVFERDPEDQYSSVNVAANTPANPNLALVTVGPGGRICYDAGVAAHDVALDVAAVIPGSQINAVDPTRLIDTRDGTTQIGPSNSLCLAVPDAFQGDVAVINITPTRAAGSGFGALRAQGTTPLYDRPVSERYSSVNFAANAPANPNLSFVTVGTDSEICYDGSVSFHDVILDLSAVLPASTVLAAEPRRLFDSRTSTPIMPGATACFPIAHAEPGDVVVVNITPVRAHGIGFGALLSSGEPPVTERPVAEQYSSVNFAANAQPNPNLGVVTVGDDGSICYNGAVSVHDIVLDVATIIKQDSINAATPARLLDTRDPVGAIPVSMQIEFHGDHPVVAAYPAPPLTRVSEINTGYTQDVRDIDDTAVDVGTAVGYIVDNGDGTVSGSGWLEERSGTLRASGNTNGETVWSYLYPGFGITCPERSLEPFGPPGLYVFETRIPVVFSGTIQRFPIGPPTYELSVSAGIGATPGDAGAVPEIDALVDTMDRCAADFAACTHQCGSRRFSTYESVEAERDEYLLNHIRINQAIVENSVINVNGGTRIDPNTNFQSGDKDDTRIRVQLTLG